MKLRKDEWERVKLGDILKLEYGNHLTAKMRKGGNVPVYGSAGIVGWHDISLTSGKTLIVGRKGSVGNVFYSDVPCFPIDTTYYVEQEKCKEDLKWIEIFLTHFDLRQLNMATAVPSLNRNIAHLIEIPLPPLEEQKQIAALFQSIDNAIEHTEAQEKNLLQTKRQLLRELFSDNKKFGTCLNFENYQTIKFGDVAQHISKRVEPAKTDLKIYAGLEHLDPDNLRIERQGSPADVKGSKLLVWEGDIIFGKRRAYQRKVAVSHFEGICSAHSMVLRAKENAIKKDFLPYFMQSDVFMDRAVQISEGSLSPAIKWKTLEKQEFTIPKMEFQEKLTDLFKQFDKVVYELRDQKETLKKLKQKLLDEILG